MDEQGLSAWVVASGPETARPAWPWLPPPDLVVCADGGLDHAVRLGLTPQIIVGDFDSVTAAALAQATAAGRAAIRRYEHTTKVETDTELAVLAALDAGATRLVLTGALGGRWDHSLANIYLLAHPRLAGIEAHIVSADSEIRLARGPATFSIAGAPDDLVSLLALSPTVTGITTSGLQYPLHEEPLYCGLGRGISNVLLGDTAQVTCSAGDLLIVVTHAA
jgi:thiamine pyrophosphokinase